MSCHASVRHVDRIAILDLCGRITLGEGCETIRNTIQDLLDVGENHIVLNLREVSYIDSAALGELVSVWTTVRNSGGQVKLLQPPAKMNSLLQVTKLYTIFESFGAEPEALASFRSGSAGA